NSREQQPNGKTAKGRGHAFHHAPKIDAHVFRKLGGGQNVIHFVGDLSQVLAGRRYINVGDSLNLVVVHLGRRLNVLNFYDSIQRGWLLQVGGADGNVGQVGRIVNG